MHRLYVFVNTDLPSMTPGKAMAHSGHAANAAVFRLRNTATGIELLNDWEGDLGFGTQINLYAPWTDVEDLVEASKSVYWCGLVNDPTYPYLASSELLNLLPNKLLALDQGDGKHMYFREQVTAAWFFCKDGQHSLSARLKEFPLA